MNNTDTERHATRPVTKRTWTRMSMIVPFALAAVTFGCDRDDDLPELEEDREEVGCPVECNAPDPLCFEANETPTDALMELNAISGRELIHQMFGKYSLAAGLSFGVFEGGNTVRTQPDSGYHKILFTMHDDWEKTSGVDNVIVAKSTQPLYTWNWYNHEYNYVGPGWVWGADGWKVHEQDEVNSTHDPGAVPFEGHYYYAIEMDNVTVPNSLLAFISSKNGEARVSFFAAKHYLSGGGVLTPF